MSPFIDTDLNNVVSLKGIGQSYDGGKNWIIKDLEFLVEDKPGQGQFVVILGASGCGKSTVLRYIAGLQKPTEGEVVVKGKAVGDDNRVSMVFQQYSSLPWMSVLDNVSLGLRFQNINKNERNDRAMEMIKKSGTRGSGKKIRTVPITFGWSTSACGYSQKSIV